MLRGGTLSLLSVARVAGSTVEDSGAVSSPSTFAGSATGNSDPASSFLGSLGTLPEGGSFSPLPIVRSAGSAVESSAVADPLSASAGLATGNSDAASSLLGSLGKVAGLMVPLGVAGAGAGGSGVAALTRGKSSTPSLNSITCP